MWKLWHPRIQNERFEIKLTEEEKALFEEKRKLTKCRNMSHFIRKCVLEKEIYQVDLDPFRDLQGLLSNATNNINQIAKRVNSTGIIYTDDINDMKKEIEHFSKELWQIHSLLLNRTSGGD
ncbi:plasmid mobilization protein [Treponema pectinovorum]|uniref:plasmid mobilization protein n=1 Tax=Treponema pectinovorum TaxID=164 RepID=UPI0011CA6C0C|nr:plasmid mobilization relaxosome protein MobC [Treponema pectinovorum]